MAQTFCKVIGVVLLLVGVIGFASPHLLGLHLTQMHNIVHLLTGGLALYFGFAASANAARTFATIFGAVYLFLGILGFIAPETVASILQMHRMEDTSNNLTPDNIVHLLLGGLFLIAGLVKSSHTIGIDTTDHGLHGHP
jgi:uncharacterized membrane protein HdeD (DUF308 family)